jgi:hypothetical protein
MKRNFIIILALLFGITATPQAQSKPPDSVVINVGNGSKITVVIKDKKDLETLKSYNFQSLMRDLISKIERQDTVSAMKPSTDYLNTNSEKTTPKESKIEEEWKTPDKSETAYNYKSDIDVKEKPYYRGTRQSISFDLGTNNYLSNGKFPSDGTDLYTVRPWGSWYAAINSVYRTRMSRVFFLEWGFGANLYNFKFQNDNVNVSYNADRVNFGLDTRNVDFRKSKLSVSYLNASFVPVIDFGGNRRKPVLFDGRRSDSFRFGFGPYAGYRIDSFTRKVYKDDKGDKQKEKDHGTYDMNNFRYGLRLQLGFKDTDLFFNYDLNNLFVSGKGPQLNAFSFGVSF